jgi:hypothetical protein
LPGGVEADKARRAGHKDFHHSAPVSL